MIEVQYFFYVWNIADFYGVPLLFFFSSSSDRQ